MTTDSVQKLYNLMVEELERSIDHGERLLPSLFVVLEEKKKQLDSCLESFNGSNSNLNIARTATGKESVDTYRQYKVAQGYLTALSVALEGYSKAFDDAYAIANSTGALREKLNVYLANANTPELVVGAAAGAAGSVGSVLDTLLKSKKDFGGN